MSTSRYPGLDHPTSSLRGPPSPPSPPDADKNASTPSTRTGASVPGKSPVGKRRAEGALGQSASSSTPQTGPDTPSHDESAKRRRVGPASNDGPDGVEFDKPPISPVVLGFNLANTDPTMKDTVRSALLMKEEQQRLIQQRRGGGSSSATSTPAKMTGEGGDGPPPSVPSQGDAMDVGGTKDLKPPAVEVQGASPALSTGGFAGFASGGLATRSGEGRQKAGGLSISTSTSADGGQTASPRGGPSPQPQGGRTPASGLYPTSHGPGQPQPRSASSSSQPGSGPSSGRPSFPPPPQHTSGRPIAPGYQQPPSNGTPSNNGQHSRGPPSSQPSHFAGQQQRPISPGPPPPQFPPVIDQVQRTGFLRPFEKFYDALIDSGTLQTTLEGLNHQTSSLQRRTEDELRKFNANHERAAQLINTLQASSTSLQEMVKGEVSKVREEMRKEVESVWRRVKQLEQGFVVAGMPIPPAPKELGVGAGGATATGKKSPAGGEEEEDQLAGSGGGGSSEGEEAAAGVKGGRGKAAGRGAKTGGTGRGGAPAKPPKGIRGGKVGSA